MSEFLRRYPLMVSLIGIGLLATLVILVARFRVEAASRQVEIVLDEPSWTLLAVREGLSPEALFADLRGRGAISLAIYEATLKRLREAGKISYLGGAEALAQAQAVPLSSSLAALSKEGRISTRAVYVLGPEAFLREIGERFQDYLPRSRVRLLGEGGGPPVLEVRGELRDVEEMGLGFFPQHIPQRGLRIVLRPRNYHGLTTEALERRFSRYAELGEGRTVIFELTEALGADRLIRPVAERMEALGFRFGRIEAFAPERRQRGEELLGQLLRPAVIRVFSIAPEELNRLAPPEAVDKYLRAARERNIRILYVRPFLQTTAGVDAIATNLEYVSAIASGLRRQGFTLGEAHSFPLFSPPRGLFFAAAAAALAGGALLLGLLLEGLRYRAGERLLLYLVLLGLGVTLLFRFVGPFTLWRKLLALGAAVAFPSLALALLPIPHQAIGTEDRPPLSSILLRSLGVLWVASAFSVAGGAIVAGLLSQWSFMMAADTFMGVKVNYLLPPVLIAFALWARANPDITGRGDVWERARHLFAEPLRLWHAGLLLVLAAALAVLLLRTGNIGLPLLGVEERLRTTLEDLFIARPRTKEYLIGHPALMAAYALAVLGGWRWAILPILAGSIGQVSMVNSFSHIHTPVVYTLWRTLGGLVLGSAVGALAVSVVVWVIHLIKISVGATGRSPLQRSGPRGRGGDASPER